MGYILAILGTIVLVIIGATAVYSSQRQDTFTVNKAERVVSSDGKSAKYLIYTDHGVFEDTDNLLFFKFNSSDVYGQLQNNKMYNCLTVGWRVPLLSWYPNLIRCEDK